MGRRQKQRKGFFVQKYQRYYSSIAREISANIFFSPLFVAAACVVAVFFSSQVLNFKVVANTNVVFHAESSSVCRRDGCAHNDGKSLSLLHRLGQEEGSRFLTCFLQFGKCFAAVPSHDCWDICTMT